MFSERRLIFLLDVGKLQSYGMDLEKLTFSASSFVSF